MVGDERRQGTDVLLVETEDIGPLRDDRRRLPLAPERPRRGDRAPSHSRDQRLVDGGVDIVPNITTITPFSREAKQRPPAGGEVESDGDSLVRLARATVGPQRRAE